MKYIFIILLTVLLVGCTEQGVYVGDLLDGERHGLGTVTWSEGTKYAGQFKNGKQQEVGQQYEVEKILSERVTKFFTKFLSSTVNFVYMYIVCCFYTVH